MDGWMDGRKNERGKKCESMLIRDINKGRMTITQRNHKGLEKRGKIKEKKEEERIGIR